MRNQTKFETIWLGLVLLLSACSTLFAQGSYLNTMGIIRGDSLGSQFGKKVVPAGDVNGDGLPDFLVGAFGNDPIYPYSGPIGGQKVYLFLGKKGALDTVPDLVFQHKAQLEPLGDVNGDGGFDFAMRESGQAYRLSIYFGRSILDTIPDGYIKGDSLDWLSDYYGLWVSAGKLSDTGNIQFVSGESFPTFNTGRFFIHNTISIVIDSLPLFRIDLALKGITPGPSQILGDVNGDGFADLAIARMCSGCSSTATVEIYLGGPSFDTLPDIILRPPAYLASGQFGQTVASVGDLNDDGIADFIVAAGRIPLVYFGGNPLDTLPRLRLDRLGDHFVNGGDINADGYNDLLVGRDEYPFTGYAYVYYGGTTMDSVVDLQIDEHDLPFPASGFGQTAAGLGDIDGDGSNDFAVGSTSNLVADQDYGYLWIFKGLLPSMGVNDQKQNVPRHFTLEQNYPNPFNSSTAIQYTLTRRTLVQLEVLNIAGQKVKTLVNQEQPAGSYNVLWDGKDSFEKNVSSGIYLYYLKAGDEAKAKKMTLIR